MMKMLFKKTLVAAALLAAGGYAAAAASNPATAQFQVLMTVTKACTVTAANVSLGTADASAAVGTSGTNNISVTCSNKTGYNVALQSANNASNAGVGTLKGAASGNTDTLTYQLYSNSGMSTVWGNNGVTAAVTGNGVAGSGNGTAQSIGVWAKVTSAAPTFVTPDSYSDTVTVSVYY
ncbi:MAG TPA: spore coat U domain-containing protein [Methylibium sp.]